MEEDDAKKITEAIMAMKGAAKKKHRDAHREGLLKLHMKPLTYRDSVAEWKTITGKGDDWTLHPAPHLKRVEHEENLEKVYCPQCGTENCIMKTRLKQNSRISNLKCFECNSVTSAKLWECSCGERWLKCNLHVHRLLDEGRKTSSSRKQTKADTRGCGQPFPKRREEGSSYGNAIENASRSNQHIVIPPGTKLAAKFPQYVQKGGGWPDA